MLYIYTLFYTLFLKPLVIEGIENVTYILTNINVLYRYLLCSGSLGEVYSEIFLKNEGVNVIRDLQSHLGGLQESFSESEWEEQNYLLSLIVIHLYREIKVDKNVVDRRKQNYANTIETQYFEEMKDLSLDMRKDVAEHKKNPYDGQIGRAHV